MKTNRCFSLKLILSAFAIFGLFFGTSAIAFAEEANVAESSDSVTDSAEKPAIWLQLSPTSNRLTIEANKTYDYTLTVENIGSEAFNFKVYATPFYASNENYDLNFSTENNYTQISRWITFKDASGNYVSEATFPLGVGESKTIDYRITTPASIPAGGQYATVFAESINNSEISGEATTGIKTVSRVGLIIYANALGETNQQASVEDVSFSSFLLSGNINGTAKVKNSGNTDFAASYAFTVKTLFGETVYEDTVSSYILPETERRVDVEWADTPMMGIFQVNYRVAAGSAVQDISKVVLVIPIFVMIIALLLLTIIIVWIILLIKKRKERKSRLVV